MLSPDTGESELISKSSDFYLEVIHGLSQEPRRIPSKYLYDETGDLIFQAIMKSHDYYLTRCEMEIFTRQSHQIVENLKIRSSDFELIELGPGNCAKSIHLLRVLVEADAAFEYVPIDISPNIIRELQTILPEKVPELRFNGITGDYFNALASHFRGIRKVVMFLGSNIGNMTLQESNQFCKKLRGYLQPGDQCIIGFDLVKHPAVIRRAYDDREGLTREFNLNLLRRINRELNADFIIDQFDHYGSYDPMTGAAKSFLVSLCDMAVSLPGKKFQLEKNECIWTETSQKFTITQIRQMATDNGFLPTAQFLDSKSWFMDVIWTAV